MLHSRAVQQRLFIIIIYIDHIGVGVYGIALYGICMLSETHISLLPVSINYLFIYTPPDTRLILAEPGNFAVGLFFDGNV